MNKNRTKELLELRDLLNKIISNKYNKQKDKSPTDLRLIHHGGDDELHRPPIKRLRR